MNQIRAVERRLDQARDLPAILDAACGAFEAMLPVIEDQQDRGGGAFAVFVMVGASAASGRHAVLAAPSLPWATRKPSAHELATIVASGLRLCS